MLKICKNRVTIIIFIVITILLTGFLIYRLYLSQLHDALGNIDCENIDYIKVNATGDIIRLKSVKEIEPTIWKGSYDGTLYYKNGNSIDIQISTYGNFFGIKENIPAMFSDGVLYEYVNE